MGMSLVINTSKFSSRLGKGGIGDWVGRAETNAHYKFGSGTFRQPKTPEGKKRTAHELSANRQTCELNRALELLRKV
jgi:hypothetical protein